MVAATTVFPTSVPVPVMKMPRIRRPGGPRQWKPDLGCPVPISPRALARREELGQFRLPKGEDPLQVAPHEDGVREPPKRPERQLVADSVPDHDGALAIGLEGVGVLPERIRAAQLDVEEAQRRLPALDPRRPTDREAANSEPIVEQSPRAHLDRPRGEK